MWSLSFGILLRLLNSCERQSKEERVERSKKTTQRKTEEGNGRTETEKTEGREEGDILNEQET